MAIEHKNILEANLHEPKGVSTATSGKSYVTDGAGSGTFKTPIVTEDTSSENEILVAQAVGDPQWQALPVPTLARIDLINSSATVVLVGADVRLSGSYTDVTDEFTEAINLNGMTFDGTHHIVIPRTGFYRVSVWISLASSSASSPIIAMDLNVNGVAAFPGSAIVTFTEKNANITTELVGFGEGSFTAGDVVGLSFAADGNTTLSLYDSVYSIVQIG